MAKCNSEDKKKNFLLSKPTKPSYRNTIKGVVKEINIIPRKAELFALSREDFAEHDSKEIAIVETVFVKKEDPETVFFACNCDDGPKLPSGCKGKECAHVTTALIKAGKIKIRAADRRIKMELQ